MTKEEARAALKEQLAHCGPLGQGTLCIEWVDGKPTPYGRTDYLRVYLWKSEACRHPREGNMRERRPHSTWLTFWVSKAFGYRYNRRLEALSIGGCGYSKPYEIASGLAGLAGHPVYVDSEHGWVKP